MSEYWKEQITKKLLFKAFILLLAGVVLLVLDYPNVKMHLFGPAKFESLEPDEIEGGLIVEPVKYTGIIHRMSSEEYPLFEAYFQEEGWTEEEIKERTLPYTINVSYMEEQDHSDLYLFMVICLVPVILAVWLREWKS